MQTLSATNYNNLRRNSHVVEADHYGDKVVCLENGHFLKLFRRKRLLSSELFVSYARRFAENARELEQRGIPTVSVLAIYRIPSVERIGVLYQPLEGCTLRVWLQACSDEQRLQLARDLGCFIAQLHDLGIYFRSLHLGNVLMMPDGCLGLIDISDMRCRRHRLGFSARLRNFHHMARYRDDMKLLGSAAALLAEAYNDIVESPSGFRQKLNMILGSPFAEPRS